MKVNSRGISALIIVGILLTPGSAIATDQQERNNRVAIELILTTLITATATIIGAYLTFKKDITISKNEINKDQDNKIDSLYRQFQQQLQEGLDQKERELVDLRSAILQAEKERSALAARYEKADMELSILRDLNLKQNSEIEVLKAKIKELEDQREQAITRMRTTIEKLQSELKDAILYNDELIERITQMETIKTQLIDTLGDVETIVKLMQETDYKHALNEAIAKGKNAFNLSTNQKN